MLALGGGLALGSRAGISETMPSGSRPAEGRASVRWLGGGVTEIATGRGPASGPDTPVDAPAHSRWRAWSAPMIPTAIWSSYVIP